MLFYAGRLFISCYRPSTSDSDTTGQSEESCTTMFSTSPCDVPKATGKPAPHHQSQPIKINVQHSSPVLERLPEFKTQRYGMLNLNLFTKPPPTLVF